MKKLLLLFFLISGTSVFAQVQNVTFKVEPDPFNEDEQITITVSNVNPSLWGVTDIYLWAWSRKPSDATDVNSPTNGTWENSNEAQKLTNNGNGTYSISFVPATLYGRTGLETIGFLVKAKNGTGDKKSQDYIAQVGSVEVPPVTEAPLPAGLVDGANVNPNDPTKVTFVLFAPEKEFVYLLGDFNNWEKTASYLLKKDSSKDRFWVEVTGLTARTNIRYQYLVDGFIKIADPYSTTILDEANDKFIDAVTYPNLPAYPTGKTTHAVSLLRTGDSSYNWQVQNFNKPAKTDLVIYELLLRDFDVLHSFDALKARLDYLSDLGVNAIELMPVSEFDGNESWGYNPAFHMALDKYYGTPNAFKQLIDECHKRGMAVILDVVYNHATGQHPYYRMWNTSNGGYTGEASADSPFFNPTATHSYSVFNDFNHSKQATQDYVKRTSQYWIEEYKIDGFRWDLTKGFTQNCSASNETCTNAFQADRVAVLKKYADYQWEIDPNFYVIFEHLGTNQEETEWVNYRLNEGKGIMVWSNLNGNYNEATMGYHDGGKSNFSWISYLNRGWTVPANIAYMESHDEERLMFKNISFGNSSGSYSVKELNTALKRNEMAGAFYFTVPGPKMIWQFGELGYDFSINRCPDGTINNNCRVSNKPIKWEYFNEPNRKALYDAWTKMLKMKDQLSIFQTDDFTMDVAATTGLKKIQLRDKSQNPDVEYITILGNFGVTTQSITPNFQKTGTWYDLMTETSINVSNVSAPISLAPGEYKIYGSSQVTLSSDIFVNEQFSTLFPNPSTGYFRVGNEVDKVEIYDVLGRKVKSFKGDFNADHRFDTSELKPALYWLKIYKDQASESRQLIVQ
ncbi:MAG: alpha-amylase family glycosyl hydrolase [Lutimonas sp.]